MLLNLDQTPLRYVLCGKTTLGKRASKSVSLNGVSDKPMITATFTISLDAQFLSMQLIYSGKTDRSIPEIGLPSSFSLSANSKHCSNQTESIKLLQEILIPYTSRARDENLI